MISRLYELFVLFRHAWRLWRAGDEAFDQELIEAYGRAWERVDEHVLIVTAAPRTDTAGPTNSVHFHDQRRRMH